MSETDERTGHGREPDLDLDAMIQRFRERAQAVKDRGIPPVAGAERQAFIEQARVDYQDFAIIGDAQGAVEDGVLVLRVDLRPPGDSAPPPASR